MSIISSIAYVLLARLVIVLVWRFQSYNCWC